MFVSFSFNSLPTQYTDRLMTMILLKKSCCWINITKMQITYSKYNTYVVTLPTIVRELFTCRINRSCFRFWMFYSNFCEVVNQFTQFCQVLSVISHWNSLALKLHFVFFLHSFMELLLKINMFVEVLYFSRKINKYTNVLLIFSIFIFILVFDWLLR